MDRPSSLRLLRRNRDFRRLYLAQLISFAGDWFATVALLGLALELTGSSAVASLVLILQTGPFFLVSPLAGVLADRFDRRRLLIGADLARAVFSLGFLLARDSSSLWIALVCVGLLSAGAAFFEPTSSASLPNLVDEEDLPAANALIGSAWGTMLAVGAALGGLVATFLGRDAAFILNAASFLASAVLIVGIHRSLRAASSPRTGDSGVRAVGGLRVALTETMALARGSRMVGALLLTKATFGMGMGVVLLLAVFASDVFRAGDAGIGVLFAARGGGALVGPFLARRRMAGSEGALLSTIALALGVFVAAYALLPLMPAIWLAALCVFAAHLGGGAQWTLSSYGLQRLVPDEIRGRVFSFDYALVLAATTASTLVAGLLAPAVGPTAALYVIIGLASLSGLTWLVWTRPLRRAASGAQKGAPPA